MGNQIGINLMVWSGELGPEELRLLPEVAAIGYDAVELPIFDAQALNINSWRDAICETGLECTVSTALPAGLTLIDEATAETGVAWLRNIVLTAARLGAAVVCGPMAVPVGELRGRGYTLTEWDCCVRSLQQVCEIAHEEGVLVAFEPLNRFETFFLNTVEDGVRLAREVDNPFFGLLLDTFHMHIEEKSTGAAIRDAAGHLVHFHASENDRGVVGSGQVAWTEAFAALQDIRYDGSVVVESFNAIIADLAGATCVWRPLAESPDVLARESHCFLRGNIGRDGEMDTGVPDTP